MTQKRLLEVKPGDVVLRVLGRTVPMQLKVTAVTEDCILCGPPGVGYAFDRATGAEIDEEIGWGPRFGVTGSFIYPAGTNA